MKNKNRGMALPDFLILTAIFSGILYSTIPDGLVDVFNLAIGSNESVEYSSKAPDHIIELDPEIKFESFVDEDCIARYGEFACTYDGDSELESQ